MLCHFGEAVPAKDAAASPPSPGPPEASPASLRRRFEGFLKAAQKANKNKISFSTPPKNDCRSIYNRFCVKFNL